MSSNNSRPPVNVGDAERLATGILGVALMAGAIRRPLLLIGGAWLIYRALSGNCKCYEALGLKTSQSQSGE
ncbi:MAG: hypothetical protein JWL90_528 [Chthoniobacteraceae bacterium]|nr:hypothetical protein [Chthoniobacteraceae bacterium]